MGALLLIVLSSTITSLEFPRFVSHERQGCDQWDEGTFTSS